jgi:hypothetical protein
MQSCEPQKSLSPAQRNRAFVGDWSMTCRKDQAKIHQQLRLHACAGGGWWQIALLCVYKISEIYSIPDILVHKGFGICVDKS